MQKVGHSKGREGVDKEVAKSDTRGTRCCQKIDVAYLKYY